MATDLRKARVRRHNAKLRVCEQPPLGKQASSPLHQRAKSCVEQDRYQIVEQCQQMQSELSQLEERLRLLDVLGQEAETIIASLNVCNKIARRLGVQRSTLDERLGIGLVFA